MHRIVPLAALLLISSLAFAAADRQSKAQLDALSVGGPSGNAVAIEKAQQGKVQITLQMKNLQPNIDYVARWYDASSCSGTPTTLGSFRSNGQGIGHLVADASATLNNVRSIGVGKLSDPITTNASCGTFVH